MDTQRQHEKEQDQPPGEQNLQALIDEGGGVAKGVPVVRTNTPRPLSFARSAPIGEQGSASGSFQPAADFPVQAPAAPPLPEEPEEGEHGASAATAPVSSEAAPGQVGESVPEFTWLFEYGLEMDEGYLNAPARLNGQAHTYGPAVLTGYRIEGVRLQDGRMALTLAKAPSPEHEVWGVLYRIPLKLTEQNGSELSVLDKAHYKHLFSALPVVVQETYRKRTVQCVTYVLPETGHKDFISHAPREARFDHPYAQRLLEAARQHHLPETYLQALATLTGKDTGEPTMPAPRRVEQNTEPLPVIDSSVLLHQLPARDPDTPAMPAFRGWLFALSLYLVGILMAALALAVIQTLGYWNQLFTASFAPLGAPWYVLLYGLLGGCISCIMALGRPSRPTVPGFVVLTWFARPFIGMVLAALAFLVLSSGLFAMSVMLAQRYAINSIIGAIAGLCEGWLFFRPK